MALFTHAKSGTTMPTIDFKDLTAILPLLAGIFTYFKTSHDRLRRARHAAGFGLFLAYQIAVVDGLITGYPDAMPGQ
jgi:hypothetical protein